MCATELLAAHSVLASSNGRLDPLQRGGPHVLDDCGIEVAECAVDGLPVDVAKRAATADEVEAQTADAERLPVREGGLNEVEFRAQLLNRLRYLSHECRGRG